MKPLAARACARPLTAPSTMTLLEQPNHASAPSTAGSTVPYGGGKRSRSGYHPASLPLDSLVGSLAARPIASLRWREMDSNYWYRGTKAVDFRSIPGIAGYRRARSRAQAISRISQISRDDPPRI